MWCAARLIPSACWRIRCGESKAASAEITKRYGFVYVDRNQDGSGTLERYKKKSFDWYRKVIASNGADLD